MWDTISPQGGEGRPSLLGLIDERIRGLGARDFGLVSQVGWESNLAYCILCFTSWIPYLGLVLLVANCIIVLIIVSAQCDGINAVAGKPQVA